MLGLLIMVKIMTSCVHPFITKIIIPYQQRLKEVKNVDRLFKLQKHQKPGILVSHFKSQQLGQHDLNTKPVGLTYNALNKMTKKVSEYIKCTRSSITQMMEVGRG